MPQPPDHIRKMGRKASRAYESAFRSCVREHGSEKGENHNCYAIATRAAKRAAGSAGRRVKGQARTRS